jgi:hypothetical protein
MVLFGVDVDRDGTGYGDGDQRVSGRVDQLPDRLVAVQRREPLEQGTAQPERVTEAVVVGADGQLRGPGPRHERRDGRRVHQRLVAQEQHDPLGRRIDHGKRRRDRRGAPGVVHVVAYDIAATEVDGLQHLVRASTDGHHDLVEPAPAHGGKGGVEQRPVADRQQLLGSAQAAGAAGGEHETGDGHQ